MSKKDRQFWESARINNATYQMYYNQLTELAVSMFEWKNLPDTIDERFMELTLFSDGKAVWFMDEALGQLCLRVAAGGNFNVYNIPNARRAYASNGYERELTIDNSVIIYNNVMRTSSMVDIEMYSRRLYNIDRTIDINANAQKTPVLLKCSENQRLSILNIYKSWQGNEPVIYGDKGLDTDSSISVLRTDAPFIGGQLMELKNQIFNECLTYLGISNVNYQKKERMVSDEVIRGMGGTIANRYRRLNARRKACEEINKMFGLDIWCDYREDFREADDEVMFSGDTGDGGMTDMVVDLRTN